VNRKALTRGNRKHRTVGAIAAAIAVLAAMSTSASASSTFQSNHFINAAKTIECKGYFVQKYQSTELVCSNEGNRIAVVARYGRSVTYSYDWKSNVVGFGHTAYILKGRYTGWGITCTSGGNWIQCHNGDGHGVVIGRTNISTF
jgi:translation initiation factor 2B subunit (eIF-2B alpha/beta/delta family)